MLSAAETPATTPRVGRRKVNFDKMPARFPDGTFARIDAVLVEGENRSDFLRVAVDAEVARRSTPPAQDTTSTLIGDGKRQARSPKGEANPIPTQTPGKPKKAVQRAPERPEEPLRFPTAPVGSLAKKPPKPKR